MPERTSPASNRRLARRASIIGGAALLLAGLVAGATAAPVDAATARVSGDGDCVNVRASAGLTAPRITCVADGSLLPVSDAAPRTVDGLAWQQVTLADGTTGWAAAKYLIDTTATSTSAGNATAAPDPVVPPTPVAASQPVPAAAHAFDIPPQGGITVGVAGTTSISALVAAQPYPVAAVGLLDPTSQRYLLHIVGAPASIQSLTDGALRPESVVMVTRAGTLTGVATPPVAAAGLAAPGTPRLLPTPPKGGLSQGTAGTNDVAAFLAAQPFAVDIAMTLDVPSQQWLTYIPGAPDWVNTLTNQSLRPDAVVTVRRSAAQPDAPARTVNAAAATPTAPTPTSTAPASATAGSSLGEIASVTYYFCTASSGPGQGDGGGFCGGTASGVIVHPGTASCASSLMGQRFRIAGDPTGQTYVCEDTGGGVGMHDRDIWFATSSEGYAWWNQTAPSGKARIIVLG